MIYRHLRFPLGLPKAVTFSYDDGTEYDIKLVKILNKYGIKCTFNINSGYVPEKSGEHRLSIEEMKEYFVHYGHEIAVHGEFHKAPGKSRPIDGIKDVLNCRLFLEEKFGRIIRGMAYPDSGIRTFSNNVDYETVRNYLIDLGIAYARALGKDNDLFELPQDWYSWYPTAHHDNPEIMDYIEKFNADFATVDYPSSRTPQLFYVWGHSFEFENFGNWNHLEEICEKLGNKNDVWYATNIEIFDYVDAYNSLVFSADGKRVYNPTVTEVWFEIDFKTFSVKPGQTVLLPVE